MLQEKIDQDLKDAARAQDKQRLAALRLLKSAVKYREIETSATLDDAALVGVVQTLIKQRKDSAAQYTAANRPELAAQENAEIRILQAYLPSQLTDDELSALVKEAVATSGAKGPRDMGGVMKAVGPKIAGRAEGRRVSDAVKAALAALPQSG